MNLYSKDFLLDGKIVYYQLKKGYRSGIEPIILASNAKKKHNKILDMGSGCGSISLIVAYRNPDSEVIGFEKNETHHKISILNHKENNLKNLKFKVQDNCIFDKKYENYFDLILSNPPFYFANKVLKSKNPSIMASKYITESNLKKWIINIILYLKIKGTAFIINRFENMDFMLDILRNFNLEVTTTPLLPFKGRKPKNALLKITKSNYFIEKTSNAIIIHDNLSKYSKDIENWFK